MGQESGNPMVDVVLGFTALTARNDGYAVPARIKYSTEVQIGERNTSGFLPVFPIQGVAHTKNSDVFI